MIDDSRKIIVVELFSFPPNSRRELPILTVNAGERELSEGINNMSFQPPSPRIETVD